MDVCQVSFGWGESARSRAREIRIWSVAATRQWCARDSGTVGEHDSIVTSGHTHSLCSFTVHEELRACRQQVHAQTFSCDSVPAWLSHTDDSAQAYNVG